MTTAHSISVLVIRLWALEGFIASAFNVKISLDVYMSSPVRTAEQYSSTIVGLSYYGLYIMVAALFFLFANQFVSLLLPKPAEKDEKFVIGADDMVQAGSFLIGLFLLARYGLQIVYSFIQGAAESSFMNFSGQLAFSANIFLLIFALWLVIRPGHVARLFSWLRTAGLPKPETAENAPKAD